MKFLYIVIQILFTVIPKGTNNNNLPLIESMAWYKIDVKPLF